MAAKLSRNLNLDLFRAASIILIIIYHLTQMFYTAEEVPPIIYKWIEYSVEIFFVLSGFLVGSIFYKDPKNETNLFAFWLKRFLRTYPPYVCALLLAYVPVLLLRNEQFDWRYLIFLQNFYYEMPYFLVSWTLCVEEHFYLIFTLLMLFFTRTAKRNMLQLCCWLILCATPAIARGISGVPETEIFGYYSTATYFRFDGIAMGCTVAFVIHRLKWNLEWIKNWFHPALLLLVSAWVANFLWQKTLIVHAVGYSILCFLTTTVMLSLYYRPTLRLSQTILIKRMALMAYSLYLTHALVIHAGYKLQSFTGSRTVTVIGTYLAIYLAGYLFYKLIEKPSLHLRDRLTANNHNTSEPMPLVPLLKRTKSQYS